MTINTGRWTYNTTKTPDRYGNRWELPLSERCATCGQPDSLNECDHFPLTREQVLELGGTPRQTRDEEMDVTLAQLKKAWQRNRPERGIGAFLKGVIEGRSSKCIEDYLKNFGE